MSDNQETRAFLIRLRPDARNLLDQASNDQRRSRASIIESLIREHLAGYERAESRLNRMLSP